MKHKDFADRFGGKDSLRGRPIRCNKQTLQTKPKGYAEVIFFGDVHIGSPECDLERAERMLEYCLKNRIYVFLMGANRYSVGAGVYEQPITPQKQFEVALELLKPLADAGLVLGNIQGNHEFRLYKDCGVNITKLLSGQLGIPYLGDACWNVFSVGGQKYRLYTLHGASGSRYVYTKLKSLVDISHNFSCDIMAMGHVHESADTSILVQEIEPRTGKVIERKKFLIITGHYLRYDRSYAQTKGLPIGKMGSPKVKFFSDKKDIHISW